MSLAALSIVQVIWNINFTITSLCESEILVRDKYIYQNVIKELFYDTEGILSLDFQTEPE